MKGTLFVGQSAATSGASRPRTCIYVPRGFQACLLRQYSGADLTAVELCCGTGGTSTKIILASVYLPGDSNDLPPSREMATLIERCEMNKEHLILGCDSNSHHTLWGSVESNVRGRALLEYLSSTKIEILNRGREPTFVTSRCQTVIDITLATREISSIIKNWHVSKEPSMSDHKTINFYVEGLAGERICYRNPRLTARPLYIEHLVEGLEQLPTAGHFTAVTELERGANALHSAIVTAYELACPVKQMRVDKAPIWWCKELEVLRKQARKHFNQASKYKRQADWDLYKETLKAYKKLVRQRQRQSWRKFCGEIESTAELSRINKLLAKDVTNAPSNLRKEDGTYTLSSSETVELLVKHHFPGCTPAPRLPDWRFNGTLTPPTEADWAIAGRVVEVDRVTWAVKSFSPYKSPGPDGVYPALLQWGLEALLPHLVQIFKACLALRYVPRIWREVKVIFIPKPGKGDYTTPKSYRPISLMSFLLKTLEKLCDRIIRDEITFQFHPNQHAYLPGRSVDSALHNVVARIEGALVRNKFALGAFIDIEGAFDKTTFDCIVRALDKRGVAPTLIGWIRCMLESRIIKVGDEDSGVRVLAGKGCPQGGVLSPLLWNIVVDSLLSELCDRGFYTIGYADDITILLTGHCEKTLFALMQTALRSVEGWCIGNSLSVNPHKTELVLFTRRRKIDSRNTPLLFGATLQLSGQAKYLGVYLDAKLRWTHHLQEKITKACNAFWQCRRAVGATWGLSPKAALWLFKAVIRPMLTHGAVVWWPRTQLRTSAKALEHVQRLACLAVTGAFRTTPTVAMEVIVGLVPLDLFVWEDAVKTALRLRAVGQWNSRDEVAGHGTILREAAKRQPLLECRADKMAPRFVFNKPYKISMESPGNADLVLYTDGSKTNSGAGAGIHCRDLALNQTIPLGKFATVFQAEIVAITHGALDIAATAANQKTLILTDSKAALQALQTVKFTSRLLYEAHVALVAASANNEVSLAWVKGHSNNEGNDRADALARKGATAPYGPVPFIPLATEVLHSLISDTVQESHSRRWDVEPRCRHAKALVPTKSDKLTKYCLQRSRSDIRLLLGILTGHCGLRGHLHKMGIVNTPLCRGCEEEDETMEHVLCMCPALIQLRKTSLGDDLPNLAIVAGLPPSALLQFILRTGWLGER